MRLKNTALLRRLESSRLTGQWADVLLNVAGEGGDRKSVCVLLLLNVDYVTSFELPFRLLLPVPRN